jgi:sulfur-oxidizing protein SoxZ
MSKRKSLIKFKPKKYSVGDTIRVDFMVMHPMETGMRKGKKGTLIPSEYINDVTFLFDGQPITKITSWESISTNPLYSIYFKVPKKGLISVEYKDNLGDVGSKTKKLKPKG